MADLGENCKRAGRGVLFQDERTEWSRNSWGSADPWNREGQDAMRTLALSKGQYGGLSVFLSVLPQTRAFWSLLWYLLGSLPDVPLTYRLSAGCLCAGGRISGWVQQGCCCCKRVHLPPYCIRLPKTSHWNMSWSHSPPETQHLSWVTVSHVVAQHTTVADDLAACKENLNIMVET